MFRSPHYPVRAGIATCAATTLFLAGCSSDASTSQGESSASAADQGPGLTDGQLRLAESLTGGKRGAADPSSAPVRVGFINFVGGTISFPESNSAVKAVATLVNEKLGGIDGHPVKIVECNIVEGDADAQKCAQKMANDESIQTVVLGLLPAGTGPIYATLSQSKNVIGAGPQNTVDLDQPDVNLVAGNVWAFTPGLLLYAQQNLKAKSMVVLYNGGSPATSSASGKLVELAKKRGMSVKSVPVTDSSQWSSALVSVGAQTADSVALIAEPPSCVPAAQAITSLGITAPVLSTGFCQDDNVRKTLGDYPKWTYLAPVKSPLAVDDPDVALYNALMKTYAPTAGIAGSAPQAAEVMFAQVKALNEVGYDKLTPATIRDAVQGYGGPLFMGPKTVKCGQYAADGARSVCDTTAFPAVYQGDGKWTDPTAGKGIDTAGIAFKK